jgi:aminoglycoside phosphotransferase (APT) family kinase protein
VLVASFLKTRRSETETEVAEPPPPLDVWAPALHAAVAAELDADLDSTREPIALPHGYGPWAFRIGSTGEADAPTGGLLARLATDRADLDREVAAMEVNREHRCAVPTVRGIVELGLDDPAGPRFALVTDPVTDVALPELIGFNLHHSNELLDGFAEHHDAIHRLPVDHLVAGGAVPVVSARDELDRIDRDRYPAEWAWLDEHVPATATPVLAHGGYQPLAVFGPPPDAWPDHGGPGKGLTVVNWCAAVLAEPEYDMAFTLVAFWSAPFFAPNRSERTAIKMIRNTLLNTYKQGYTARRDVDPDRLRFWQAFHALRGLARLAGAYDADGSPFAASDRGAVPVELGPELHRHFRQLTRVR